MHTGRTMGLTRPSATSFRLLSPQSRQILVPKIPVLRVLDCLALVSLHLPYAFSNLNRLFCIPLLAFSGGNDRTDAGYATPC